MKKYLIAVILLVAVAAVAQSFVINKPKVDTEVIVSMTPTPKPTSGDFVQSTPNATRSPSSAATPKTNTSGALALTSPNGGEAWFTYTQKNITWTAPLSLKGKNAVIFLIMYVPCPANVECPLTKMPAYIIASNISIGTNSYSWRVGEAYSLNNPSARAVIQEGKYYVQICDDQMLSCDISKSMFDIKELSGN